MVFALFVLDKANELLQALPPADYTICYAALKDLAKNPYPGVDGDKEKLSGRENKYRLHIGRTYTAIYKIDKEKKRVCVFAFGRIGAMHNKY